MAQLPPMPGEHPLAQRSPAPAFPGSILDAFGRVTPPTTDPANQPPRDPLANLPDAKSRAGVVFRDIPITTIQTTWSVQQVKNALGDLTVGLFDQPAQLVDSIVGDDRVQATLGSRTGGLFGRPVRFKAANDTPAARECLDAWRECWPTVAPEAVLTDLQQWGVMLRFAPAQILWDTSGEIWRPYLRPWHPRYSWWHPTLWHYVATTMDGLVPLVAGTGKWFIHAPAGEYRGWMRGAVRATAQPWLIRNFAYRDWARYSERHGMPMLKAKVPATADPVQRNAFVQSVNTLGQETAILLPQGVDQGFSYDLEMLEATDRSWESFPGLIDRCDMSIVLALLYQNLTTEVKEGSFAAARVHGDVRQSCLESDNSALRLTIYSQLARPFAAFNFGDPDLAPWTDWDIEPVEDREGQTRVFQACAAAVKTMREAGFEFTPESLAEFAWQSFGLRIRPEWLAAVEPLIGGGNRGVSGSQQSEQGGTGEEK